MLMNVVFSNWYCFLLYQQFFSLDISFGLLIRSLYKYLGIQKLHHFSADRSLDDTDDHYYTVLLQNIFVSQKR